jgi:hypothetical protein
MSVHLPSQLRHDSTGHSATNQPKATHHSQSPSPPQPRQGSPTPDRSSTRGRPGWSANTR